MEVLALLQAYKMEFIVRIELELQCLILLCEHEPPFCRRLALRAVHSNYQCYESLT